MKVKINKIYKIFINFILFYYYFINKLERSKMQMQYSPLVTDDIILKKEEKESDENIESVLLNRASFFSCYVCLANTIMGAGILGLPYAFSRTGYVIGFILMIICAASSCFSLHELSICAKQTVKPSSFYSVAMISASQFAWLIDLAVAIKCFGVSISYLIILSGLMPEAMKQLNAHSLVCTREFWILISFCIIAPIAFQNSLEVLKFTSTLSILFLSFVTIMIILFSIHNSGIDPCHDINIEDQCVGDFVPINNNSLQILSALPIYVFAFTCHQNTFPVVNELHNPTQTRCNLVFFCAIGTALTAFMVVAFAGYYTYGSNVESNVLKSYPGKIIYYIKLIK